MTRKNIGARQAKNRQYDKDAIQSDADLSSGVDMSVWDTVERQTRDALAWCDQRGNTGDNAPESALKRLLHACVKNDIHDALAAAVDVLSGKQHPTARDICSTPAKHLIYNACGRRAHTYRTDS